MTRPQIHSTSVSPHIEYVSAPEECYGRTCTWTIYYLWPRLGGHGCPNCGTTRGCRSLSLFGGFAQDYTSFPPCCINMSNIDIRANAPPSFAWVPVIMESPAVSCGRQEQEVTGPRALDQRPQENPIPSWSCYISISLAPP
jgi:hypothetical protein